MAWLSGIIGADRLVKGRQTRSKRERSALHKLAPDAAKGLLTDPMKPFDNAVGGWQRRPSRLSYNVLRSMAYRTPLIKAIVLTRVNQVAAFAQLPTNDYDIGFVVRHRDKNKVLTKATQKKLDEISRFILFCGEVSQDRLLVGDTFQSFLRKLVRDSLIFDQMNFQIVPRRNGKPYELIAMPAGSMRMREVDSADSWDWTKQPSAAKSKQKIRLVTPDEMQYVQVVHDKVVAEFSAREMAWGVRNPVSDLDHYGYGWSELEDLVHHITSVLWAEEYNRKFFSQGSNMKGLLNFKGSMPQNRLEEFKKQWDSLISGVHNAWRTPVVNSEDVQWIPMHASNRDMEFSNWVDYLIKIACAHYQIDPSEINFSYGNTGQTSQVFQNSQESKLKSTRDRGLRPILTLIEELMTKHVVMSFDEDFEFAFTGIDVDDESDRLAKAKDYAQSFMTIDEIRAQYDLDPMADGKGDMILHAVWQQRSQVIDAQEEGGEEGEGGEAEGDGGGFSEDDFASLDNDEGGDEKPEAKEADQPEPPPEAEKAETSGDFSKGGHYFYEL